jgi:Uma2 family endonuclease
MTTLQAPPVPPQPISAAAMTLADLLEKLGGISPSRVRFRPHFGDATEADVIAIHSSEKRLFELVDGVLVEKPMGFRESMLAAAIIAALGKYLEGKETGVFTGPDGMMRLFPGLVRIPDVAYISNQRLPDGQVPLDPIPSLVPDLAVEVLSRSNTFAEMELKRKEYFSAGVRLVWLVDPELRTVEVFKQIGQSHTLHEQDILEGGEVLPGFSLSLARLFSVLDHGKPQSPA